jgi:hypothetical protein
MMSLLFSLMIFKGEYTYIFAIVFIGLARKLKNCKKKLHYDYKDTYVTANQKLRKEIKKINKTTIIKINSLYKFAHSFKTRT